MLDEVQGLVGFLVYVGQRRPNQKGAGNVVALNPSFSKLAAFKPGELFSFSVKLLNLPTPGAHCVCIRRRVLSEVVCHDKIRAASRHHKPEQFDPMPLGEIFDLDQLTNAQFLIRPCALPL